MNKSKYVLSSIVVALCSIFILMPGVKADTEISVGCGGTDSVQNIVNGHANCPVNNYNAVLTDDVTINGTGNIVFTQIGHISIDLNGHNLTFANPVINSNPSYTVKITNSGTISTTTGNKHGIVTLYSNITNNYGHMTFENVRVEGTNSSALLIESGGIVTIKNNAQFYNKSSIGYGILSHGGSLDIRDSEITSLATNGNAALKIDDYERVSNTTIDNSDFAIRSSNGYAIDLMEDSTNKGSTFTFNSGESEGIKINSQSSSQFNVVINGGTFTGRGNYGLLAGNGATFTLNGGTFKGNTSAIGTFTTSKNSFIGTNYYLAGYLQSTSSSNPPYMLSLKEATVVPVHYSTIYSVKSYPYTGNVILPTVKLIDYFKNDLKKGTDYTLTCVSGCKNVGSYNASLSFVGNYAGLSGTLLPFKIVKANNPMVVTAKNKKVKYKKVAKKKQTVQAITVTKNQGALTYAKVSGKKNIKVNKTTGKITVKKKTKKGTYKVKVKVTAAGNGNYNSSNKTVKFKIKVK